MSQKAEIDPTEERKESFAVEQIEQSEPSRLPPAEQAEAWDDSDVELADEDGPDGNLSGIDQ